MKYALITLLSLFFLNSCCSPCMRSSPKFGEKLENATWTLIEFRYNPIENSPITLHFNGAEKMIYGTAACNNFFGGYTLYDDQKRNIKIGNVGATRKACPDMETELNFTAALPSVVQVKIEGETLLMIDSLQNTLALLVRAKM